MSFKCKYCEREFRKETTLEVHICEQKRRYQTKEDPATRIAFQNFLAFYETTQGSAKNKTFDDFAKSAYYRAFVKFGNYCVNARVVAPTRFSEWLLKHNKRIDYWGSDKLYEEFLREYVYRENATDALTRALETSVDWAEDTDNPTEHFLRYGNSNKLCHYVTTGKITGWTIFNCESGHEWLESLNPEQLAIVYDFLDPDKWSRKIRDYPGDTEYMRDMLKRAGW